MYKKNKEFIQNVYCEMTREFLLSQNFKTLLYCGASYPKFLYLFYTCLVSQILNNVQHTQYI